MTKSTGLADLHDGIVVPEYEAFIPWLIEKPDLFRLIPSTNFSVSIADWPMLQMTLFGFAGVFGFNFATHPEEKLIEVQFQNFDTPNLQETFLESADRLRECLGTPNVMDSPLHLRWDDGVILVNSAISSGQFPLLGRTATTHRLSVFTRKR